MSEPTDVLEKAAATEVATSVEVDELQEALDGYILNPAKYPNSAAGLKLTPDGQYVLIPQPSDLPRDPLNWSPRKKAYMLAIVAYIAALADYTGGTAIITMIPQAIIWDMPQVSVQRAIVGNIFCIGACGLIFVALANYFGRLPLALIFQAVFFATCAWSAAATTFDSYLAARIVNGLFCSIGQGGAIMWIKDMYFFHEHPRAINWVEFGIVVSPYLGPMITAFMVNFVSWNWAFWLCTILAGISFLLVFCMDETLFDRTSTDTKPTTTGPRWQRLIGIEQARTSRSRSFIQAVLRPVVAFTKLPVFLTLVYYFLNAAWVVGVNTTVSIWLTNFYGFTPKGIGYFYFFGIIGPLIGWLVGHWLHDWVGRLYGRKYGRIDPEARLIIAYPATLLLFIALLVLGFALQHQWHYMILAVFSAVQTVGLMVVTTAINAYLLDAYPEGSGEVGAWITASRNWGGFMVTFIQVEWVTKSGPATVFCAQAGITIASMLFLVVLQAFGKRMRRMQGRMVFNDSKSK